MACSTETDTSHIHRSWDKSPKPRPHFSRPLGRTSPNVTSILSNDFAYEKMLPAPPKKTIDTIYTTSRKNSAQQVETAQDSVEAQMRPTIRYNPMDSPTSDTHDASHSSTPRTNPSTPQATLQANAFETSGGRENKSSFTAHISNFRSNSKDKAINKDKDTDRSKPSSPLSTRFINSNTRWDAYSSPTSSRPFGAPPDFPKSSEVTGAANDTTGLVPGKIKKASLAARAAKIGRETLALDTWPVKKAISPNPNNYTAVKHAPSAGPVPSDSDMSLLAREADSSFSITPSLDEDMTVVPPSNPDYRQSPRESVTTTATPTLGHQAPETEAAKSTDTLSIPNIQPPSPTSEYAESEPRRSVVYKAVNRKSVPSRVTTPASTPSAVERDAPRFVPYRSPVISEPTGTADNTSMPSMTVDGTDNTSVVSPRTPGVVREDTANSRFSWTTVNTATTYQQDSPPGSPSEMPPLPAYASKFMVKPRRGASLANRLPTPPLSGSEASPGIKALPLAPTDRENLTHIDTLLLQQDNVALRRANIQKVIHELTKIDNASPLDVDWKARKANIKKLEEHRVAVRDIEHEEHDIGMAIVRARRRLDKEQGTQTSIWIRRVTG